MKIIEYWARLVAAGLAPDFKDVYAIYNKTERAGGGTDYGWLFRETSEEEDDLDYFSFVETIDCDKPNNNLEKETIQLRKDGIDLYRLEWRKPTEQNIGKMCWFYNGIGNKAVTHSKLYNAWFFEELTEEYLVKFDEDCDYRYCLLADHEQIAPTVKDFERVYNDG